MVNVKDLRPSRRPELNLRDELPGDELLYEVVDVLAAIAEVKRRSPSAGDLRLAWEVAAERASPPAGVVVNRSTYASRSTSSISVTSPRSTVQASTQNVSRALPFSRNLLGTSRPDPRLTPTPSLASLSIKASVLNRSMTAFGFVETTAWSY